MIYCPARFSANDHGDPIPMSAYFFVNDEARSPYLSGEVGQGASGFPSHKICGSQQRHSSHGLHQSA
jgi:hypothetical protein